LRDTILKLLAVENLFLAYFSGSDKVFVEHLDLFS
jgi:hypothetical protein